MSTPPQPTLPAGAPIPPSFALPPALLGVGVGASTAHDAGAGASSSVPLHPVAAMLSREAQAWSALAALHGQILTTTQAATPQHDELSFSEKKELVDQRTAHYVAALSQLASTCDALHSEALRARGLRRARHQVESTAVDEVLRTHTLETLASGAEAAKSTSMSIAGVTAELRASSAHSRQQIAHTRTLLETLKDAAPLQPGVEVLVGLRQSDGRQNLRRVGHVMQELEKQGGHEVTAERIVAALAADDADVDGERNVHAHATAHASAHANANAKANASSHVPESSHKTFARRSGDRVNNARRKTPLESD